MAKLWSVDVAAAHGSLSDSDDVAHSTDELCITLSWLLNEVLGSDHWREDLAKRRAQQHQLHKVNNDVLKLVKARDKHNQRLKEYLDGVRRKAENEQQEKAEKA